MRYIFLLYPRMQGTFYLALDCCCARTDSVGTGPLRGASRALPPCRLLAVAAAAAAAAPRSKKQHRHRLTSLQTLPPIRATSAGGGCCLDSQSDRQHIFAQFGKSSRQCGSFLDHHGSYTDSKMGNFIDILTVQHMSDVGGCPSPRVKKPIPSPRANNQGASKKILAMNGGKLKFFKIISLIFVVFSFLSEEMAHILLKNFAFLFHAFAEKI